LRCDYVPLTKSQQLESVTECHRLPIREIGHLLESLPNVDHPDFRRSASIRSLLGSGLNTKDGWNHAFLGIGSITNNLHNKNYVIDYVFDSECRGCPSRHRLQVEVCFDNRQAVGTNIFKLEASARAYQNRTSGSALSLIVCGDRKYLKNGGWDAGVADEDEYQIAIDTAYEGYVTTNIALLVLRG
jgi:hypothetical protein